MSASEQEVSPAPENLTLEDLIRSQNSRLSPLISYILGLANGDQSQSQSPERQESDEARPVRQRIVLINPAAQSVVVIEGSGNLESFFRDLASKDGPLPATKASIEAMPAVEIAEEGADCAICLEEYEIGGEAREMPCKHRYHSSCIEKWLGIHGSCPICRYKMPVDAEEENKKGEEEDGGRRVLEEIWVSFYVPDPDRRDSDSDSGRGSESGETNSDSGEQRDEGAEDDESSTTQEMMDID